MELKLEYIQNVCEGIRQEMARVMVGRRELVEQVLVAVFCEGHVLLEGVPGLGKTLLVKTLAKVLGLKFNRIQFTPDLMPADIVGTVMVSKSRTGERVFRFQKGPIFANIVLADEINRATAKTQSALLEAMAERTVTVGGHTHEMARPFFVIGTQNPIEMEGTYPLPEAQLDRFFFKLNVEYPSAEELVRIVDRNVGEEVPEPDVKASADLVNKIAALVRSVPVPSHVKEYAARVVLATHPTSSEAVPKVRKYVAYGASPRGLLALIHASKARALLEGRLNVSLDDVRAVAVPALRHRVILSFEGEAEGVSVDELVGHIVREVS